MNYRAAGKIAAIWIGLLAVIAGWAFLVPSFEGKLALTPMLGMLLGAPAGVWSVIIWLERRQGYWR